MDRQLSSGHSNGLLHGLLSTADEEGLQTFRVHGVEGLWD